MTPEPLDAAARRVVCRAAELAAQPLDGIEAAAHELADLAGDDVRVIEAARRIAGAALVEHPDTSTKQMVALVRRAIEVGMSRWDIQETGPLP